MQKNTAKEISWFYKLSSYKHFVPLAEKISPYFFGLSLIAGIIGIAWGLGFAPADYQQGNSFRIIYIHVPAAMLSTMLYMFMAILSAIFLIWRIKLCSIMARSAASLGVICTLIALVTGAIWGRPTWGTWWEWDVRLTSVLILFFIYMGYIALDNAIEERQTADKAIALLAIIGVVNVFLIKASVYIFNTLHQKSTLFSKGGPKMPPEMLTPLLIMIAAYALFTIAYLCKKSVNLIYREQLLKHYLDQK